MNKHLFLINLLIFLLLGFFLTLPNSLSKTNKYGIIFIFVFICGVIYIITNKKLCQKTSDTKEHLVTYVSRRCNDRKTTQTQKKAGKCCTDWNSDVFGVCCNGPSFAHFLCPKGWLTE